MLFFSKDGANADSVLSQLLAYILSFAEFSIDDISPGELYFPLASSKHYDPLHPLFGPTYFSTPISKNATNGAHVALAPITTYYMLYKTVCS